MTAATPTEPPLAGPAFKLGARPALDGIRGIGIIFVVIFHSMTYLVDWYGAYGESVLPGAFLAVDVFFVLSGFLITSLLLEERAKYGAYSMPLFYARRALRLLPTLFAVLFIFGVYTVVSDDVAVKNFVRAAFRMLTYSSNFVIGEDQFLTEWFGQSWSLAIEEQFYIVWPLVLLGLLKVTKARPKAVAAAIGVAVVALALWRIALIHMHDELWSSVYYRTDARLDEPLIGTLLAVVLHYGLIKDKPRPWVGVGALGVWFAGTLLASPFKLSYYQGWSQLMLLVSVALILGVMHGEGPAAKLLDLRPLRWFGRLSYTLYLVHVAVFAATLRIIEGEGRNVTRVVVANVVALAITVLIRVAVEEPALRIKSRFNRSSRQGVAGVAGAPEEPVDGAPAPEVDGPARRRPLRADGSGGVAPAPTGEG